MGAGGVKVNLSYTDTWQLSFQGLMGHTCGIQIHIRPSTYKQGNTIGLQELKPQETSQLNVLVVSRHILQVSQTWAQVSGCSGVSWGYRVGLTKKMTLLVPRSSARMPPKANFIQPPF